MMKEIKMSPDTNKVISLRPKKKKYKHYNKYNRKSAYAHSRWRRVREVQLSKEPLCQRCKVFGFVTIAVDVDHIIPHRGDEEKFWKGSLQSLCKSCHSYKTQQEQKNIALDYTSGSEDKVLFSDYKFGKDS